MASEEHQCVTFVQWVTSGITQTANQGEDIGGSQ